MTHPPESDVARSDSPADSRVRRPADTMPNVRASDLEPYTGLRYLSKLFRAMAVLLAVLLVVEGLARFADAGGVALPTLLFEGGRTLVLAGILWGIGDFAILLVDIGHDVRAARIMLTRQELHAHGAGREPAAARPRPQP